jgi:DNA-binding CsgD family transcriptional regulator
MRRDTRRMLTLVGRQKERAALDILLGAASTGAGGTLVLRGEPGTGKTALLDHAVQWPGDLRVARVAGIESELDLEFGALHRLLVPFLDRLDRLPAPQHRTLRTIFGLDWGGACNRFLAGAGALSLLADAARERPLLLIVDDAHWLDQESAQVLAFVAHRLHADAIACLFGMREPAERSRALDGLSSLHVGGLPEAQARELLDSLAGRPLGARLVERVIAGTGGNPLALAEVARQLAGGSLPFGPLSFGPLSVGSRLEGWFLLRVMDLPAETRALLLVMAADLSGDRALLWRAASRLGISAGAADPAVAGGLIATFGAKVAFRHPLVRSAVYHGAPPAERCLVHGALAAASDPRLDSDRRAWHRAAATIVPDEEIAAELAHSADRARQRGGHGSAAALLTRAAELTPQGSYRTERMLAAAVAELTAGAPSSARVLLNEAAGQLAEPLARGQAQRLDGRLRFALGSGGEAPSVLLQAARVFGPLDPGRARETLLEALQVALYAGRTAIGVGVAEVARAMSQAPVVPQPGSAIPELLLNGYAAVLNGDRTAGIPLLRRAVAMLCTDEIPVAKVAEQLLWLLLGCRAAGELLDDAALHTVASRGVQLIRDAGALTALPLALKLLGMAELLSGKFAAAEACRAEELQLSAATGNPGVFGTSSRDDVPVLAWRGREAETRSGAALLTRDGIELGRGIAITMAQYSLATLELGLGQYEAALDRWLDVYREDPFFHGTLALPGLIEAAARSGDRRAASAALDRLTERALASGTRWALGLLSRSRALLASDDAAEPLYQGAIGNLQRTRATPDLARAHLLYGEWLRRQRRRRDARSQLRTAHQLLESMGADAFAARAANELRAAGERARPQTPEINGDLTAQEAQIAGLVAAGASNREIAEKLFISTSTVEYHLRKVFRKLDLTSRTQLAHVLAPGLPRSEHILGMPGVLVRAMQAQGLRDIVCEPYSLRTI